MPNRIDKINELIKHTVAEIIERELSLKAGIFITVAKVDTTPDLRYTRVSVSIFPEKDIGYGMKTLQKEAYKIQGKVNKKLKMRPLPRIEFRLDMTEAKADEIEKLLKKI